MKFVTWNCNGAFRKKFDIILSFDADIYVIQECENPAESVNQNYIDWAKNYLWIGDTKNKGLGIFARPEIRLEKLDWSNRFKNHSVKHFLPCRINQSFNLLAVWTHKNDSPNFEYIGQFWKYLQVNKEKFNDIILIGDFNSSAIWHQFDKWWNHSDVIDELKSINIESLYHSFTKEKQGKEKKPTLYFQRNLGRSYHIDYIFSSIKYSERLKKLEVGQSDKWIQNSDHMPIFCEIEMSD